MASQHMFCLLQQAAEISESNAGIHFYGNREHGLSNSYLSYQNLLESAYQRAPAVKKLIDLCDNKIVILHLENGQDSILWFWSIVAAGGIPCLSTLFNADLTARQKQFSALQQKLGNAGIVTNKQLAAQFEDREATRLIIEDYEDKVCMNTRSLALENRHTIEPNLGDDSLAILMLTSGSTGNPKAVRLTHAQIFASLEGKSSKHRTTSQDVFLSWIALNHVANLLEIHLHAMKCNAAQVQVETSEVLHDPMFFLDKISIHRVTYTFAPNFFLCRLIKTLAHRVSKNEKASTQPTARIDLSALRALISGGEANDNTTCTKITHLFQLLGAKVNFLRPGFGMTETCAGCIYNLDCPSSSDILQMRDFASLGTCVPKLEMRTDGNGELQLKGAVLFGGYYNDPEATKNCWTEDGWFRTGDQGYIDPSSGLNLTCRTKDVIIVNGLNHNVQAIEYAIEEAGIDGIIPTYVVAFAHRPVGSDTERLVVLYAPAYDDLDWKARVTTATSISRAILTNFNIHAYCILPLSRSLLPKSSLGKFSRAKFRENFGHGTYKQLIEEDNEITLSYKSSIHEAAATVTERIIAEVYSNVVEGVVRKKSTVSRNDSIFNLGFSSIDILKIKLSLQNSLKIKNIPISIFFSHPIVAELAEALDNLQQKNNVGYDPVVVLQPAGTKTPLWLLHPGVGDILIFMPLARYITDRPVYALRARGFDGEPFFTSTSEIVSTYHAAIKRLQPQGPYAIAGYSFGSIMAFEITKLMQQSGDEVRFLAAIDQLPHFKIRARSYDWYECVISIAFFVGLMDEENAYRILPQMRSLAHDQVLDHILSLAPPARVQELGLSRSSLDNWAKLALGLKKIVSDYDPAGMVKRMDVFYTAEPREGILKDEKEEWLRDYVAKWSEFVDGSEVRYHAVKGSHRTLISVPHLRSFQALFRKVMKERGV